MLDVLGSLLMAAVLLFFTCMFAAACITGMILVIEKFPNKISTYIDLKIEETRRNLKAKQEIKHE